MKTHRNVRLLALHNFFLDFRPYSAIAIVYFASITGSFALGMAVFTVVMVSSAVLEVPTGIFSDTIGRCRSIILGSAASTTSLVLYALGGSFWLLALGACFEGMSRAFFSGNNDALLHDTLVQEGKADDYAEILGKTSSMFQLALAIGALIGGLVGEWWSLRLVIWISVIPQIACLITSFFFIEPKVHTEETTNVFAHLKEAILQFKKNVKLRVLSAGSIFQYGIGESMFQFEPAFIAALWPTWGVGIARMLSHFFGWLSFWFAGAVIKRHSATLTLFVALAISNIIGLIAFGFPTTLSPLLVASMSLVYGFIMVSQNTLLQKEITENQRATMGSLNSLFGSLFFGMCAIGIGLIGDKWGAATALLIGEISLLLLLPLYWLLFVKR